MCTSCNFELRPLIVFGKYLGTLNSIGTTLVKFNDVNLTVRVQLVGNKYSMCLHCEGLSDYVFEIFSLGQNNWLFTSLKLALCPHVVFVCVFYVYVHGLYKSFKMVLGAPKCLGDLMQ
jgi:hypothetical protein